MPRFVAIGGSLGAATGYLLQWYCNAVSFPINIGGRPPHAPPSFIPITFELTILFGAFGAFFGLFALLGLPRLHHPVFEAPGFVRATVDRFWISAPADDEEQRAALELALRAAGADEITVVQEPFVVRGIFVATALLGAALLGGACHPADFDPMEQQPKLLPYAASDVFGDGQAMRAAPVGVVPRERILDESAPPLTAELLRLGRARFDGTCAACHGRLGDGNSVLATKVGLRPPPSLHEARLRALDAQSLYTIIRDGYGLMPRLGARLDPTERWAIIAYVRALQLSQHALVDGLPAALRESLVHGETAATPAGGHDAR